MPVKPVECVTKPGELLFIPSRWWHTAINLEESIAVTQNVVNRQNLAPVIQFLKSKKKQDLFHAFETAVEEKHPGVIEEHANKIKPKPSAWETLTSNNDSSFSFGFSFTEQDDPAQ